MKKQKSNIKQILPLAVLLLILTASFVLASSVPAVDSGKGDFSQRQALGKSSPLSTADAEELDLNVCGLKEVLCAEEGKSATVKHGGENPSFQAGLPSSEQAKNQILQIAQKYNFQWPNYLLKLAYCESRYNPKARNDNGKYGIDRGIFQINNRYHPQVSDAQADDIEFATKWTMDKINQGKQHLWSCNKIIKS